MRKIKTPKSYQYPDNHNLYFHTPGGWNLEKDNEFEARYPEYWVDSALYDLQNQKNLRYDIGEYFAIIGPPGFPEKDFKTWIKN
jgi:hypothetical protein